VINHPRGSEPRRINSGIDSSLHLELQASASKLEVADYLYTTTTQVTNVKHLRNTTDVVVVVVVVANTRKELKIMRVMLLLLILLKLFPNTKQYV